MQNRITAINPYARIFRSEYSVVDPKVLLNIGGFSLKRALEMDPKFLDEDDDHVHDDTVSSVAFRFPDFEVNFNKLEVWIAKLQDVSVGYEVGAEIVVLGMSVGRWRHRMVFLCPMQWGSCCREVRARLFFIECTAGLGKYFL